MWPTVVPMTRAPAPGPAQQRATTGGLVSGLGGMALLGSGVAVTGALDGVADFWIQALRYAAGAVALIVLARLLGHEVLLPRRDELPWVIGGALSGLVGFNLALVYGTRHAEPAVLGSAVACIPIVLAVAGPITQGRRPPPRLVAGAVLVAAGAVLVSGWGRTDLVGLLAGMALIGCEAGFTLLGARVLGRLGSWSYSTHTMVAAALIFVPVAAVLEPGGWRALDRGSVVALLYLGVLVTAVAFVLWFRCVQRVGSGRAGLATGVAAPASALVAMAIGAPAPGLVAWFGMIIIGAGLVFGSVGPLRASDVEEGEDAVPARR